MNDSEAREILGVSAEASALEVKQAFRRLVLIAHPDRGGSSEAFIELNEAYETLTGQRQSTTTSDRSTSSTRKSASNPRDAGKFAVATAAMTILNLDPDEFQKIERACYEWLGGVSQLNKRAAKQLFWLAVGRVPIGAAISVAKGQRFKRAAHNMLEALAQVSSPRGISSPSSWLEFATCYVQMLKLSGMKEFSREFDSSAFLAALNKIEQNQRR